MKYVLDSCVAFKWLVPEQDTDKALRLLDDFQKAIHELVAPDILPVETTHALTRAQRQGRVTPQRCNQLFLDLLNQAPPLHPHLPLLPKAYSISLATRQGVYDCLYVALAEQEQCELVTSDDRLLKNLGPIYPFIIPLASFP
jgi:predicted nucleic acid-binding protein